MEIGKPFVRLLVHIPFSRSRRTQEAQAGGWRQGREHAGCVESVTQSTLFAPAPMSSTWAFLAFSATGEAAAPPAPVRPVQELMPQYYGKCWGVLWGHELSAHAIHTGGLTLLQPLLAAARLFPHQHMYKWLAYGNGEWWGHAVVHTHFCVCQPPAFFRLLAAWGMMSASTMHKC